LLRIPRHRWENNIKKNLEIGYEDVNWMLLAYDRVQCQVPMNPIMNLQAP